MRWSADPPIGAGASRDTPADSAQPAHVASAHVRPELYLTQKQLRRLFEVHATRLLHYYSETAEALVSRSESRGLSGDNLEPVQCHSMH